MKTTRRLRRRRAFTLVEVLLVLVILVIIGSLAMTAYGPIQRKAKIDAAKAQIELLESTLKVYQLALDDYPTTQQGLQALRTAPADLVDPNKWQGPYLDDDVPADPWGSPYQYEYPGQYSQDKPDIWSFGPDGVNGNEDDVGNWAEGSS
jgi:general secretion pathway protein G